VTRHLGVVALFVLVAALVAWKVYADFHDGNLGDLLVIVAAIPVAVGLAAYSAHRHKRHSG
jgi:hypothetical protein